MNSSTVVALSLVLREEDELGATKLSFVSREMREERRRASVSFPLSSSPEAEETNTRRREGFVRRGGGVVVVVIVVMLLPLLLLEVGDVAKTNRGLVDS